MTTLHCTFMDFNSVSKLFIHDFKPQPCKKWLISAYSHSMSLMTSLYRCAGKKYSQTELPEDGISRCRNALEWFSTDSVVHRSWLMKWCLELICYTHSDTIFWTPAWLLFNAFLQSVFDDNNTWGTVASSSLDLLNPYNFYLWVILKDEMNSYDTCSEGNLQKSIAFSFTNRTLTCNTHVCYTWCVSVSWRNHFQSLL